MTCTDISFKYFIIAAIGTFFSFLLNFIHIFITIFLLHASLKYYNNFIKLKRIGLDRRFKIIFNK